MKTTFLFAVFFLYFLTGSVLAQPVQDIINEAYSNNLKIQSIRENLKAALYRAESVSFLPPPQIAFEISQMPFTSINYFNMPFSQSLTFSQMFMPGGKLDAMREAELSNAQVQEAALREAMVSLKAEIEMAYYDLWLSHRSLEVLRENIELLSAVSESIKGSLLSGASAPVDLLLVETKIAVERNKALDEESKSRELSLRISRLAGRQNDFNSGVFSSTQFIPVKDFLLPDSLPSDGYFFEQLEQQNPSLEGMHTMAGMYSNERAAVEKNLIPDVMLSAMVMRMPRGMPLTTTSSMEDIGMGGADYMYSLMASVTLPFLPWSRGAVDNKTAELEAKIKGINFLAADMKLEMQTRLVAALNRFSSSRKKLDSYQTILQPLRSESVSFVARQYLAGNSSITMVLDMMSMAEMGKMDYYMAYMECASAISTIEMIIGGPIK